MNDKDKTGKISAVVPTTIEFEDKKALFDFFHVDSIIIIKSDNEWVGGRAEIYYKGRLKPTRVRMFINDDGTLRSPMRNGEVESPVDKGTPWTRNGKTTMLHETYVPNAILAQIDLQANAQIPARPELYKKQQEVLAQRKSEADKLALEAGGTPAANADDNPFDDKKDEKKKTETSKEEKTSDSK